MLDTKRGNEIANYIKTHPHQRVANKDLDISYGGKLHSLPAYKIPTKYLIHNIRNGRFRAELLEQEELLGRQLDPTDSDDVNKIRELLLNQNPVETEALKEDISNKGQLDPGIVTFDGAVINANRRMAILHTLYEATSDDQYQYLKVSVLPKGVDELDLWKIEAGLQFGRDFRLEYGGVNELLKIREGYMQGLSPTAISVVLLGRFSETQIQEKLDTLKLIDSYLLFIGKKIGNKGDYHLITEARDLEKFISLQSSVIRPLTKDSSVSQFDIGKLTIAGFTLIKNTGIKHMDVRQLRHIAANEKAKEELMEPFQGKIPSNINKVNVSSDELEEAFTTAQEVIENEKEKEKPERLLKRAKSALDGVNEKSEKLKEAHLRQLMDKIDLRLKILKNSSTK